MKQWIDKLKVDLTIFGNQIQQVVETNQKLQGQLSMLQTAYNGIVIERDNLMQKISELEKQLDDAKRNTNNKKS